MHVLLNDEAQNEYHAAAKAYFEANAAIKRANAIKDEKREVLERRTGKNVVGDYQVNFSSHEEEVVDPLQLNAFLAKHGVSMDDFKVRKVKTRLEVKRIA